MSDQEEPERLSHEWHARDCDSQERIQLEAATKNQWGTCPAAITYHLARAEHNLDLAAKLRQAAKDAARVEDLRDALDFATSGLTLILADVRLGITVDTDILDLRMECQKALKEKTDED